MQERPDPPEGSFDFVFLQYRRSADRNEVIIPRHQDGTPLTIREQLDRAKGRKEGRVAKGVALGLRKRPQRTRPIKSLSKRGEIKKAIVRTLGLISAKKHGPYCRYGPYCPRTKKIGMHKGDTACHVIPQMRGDAARFIPENVIWGCRDSNYGEKMNRSLYREIHIKILGRYYVESIEAAAGGIRQYPTHELLELLDEKRKELTSFGI